MSNAQASGWFVAGFLFCAVLTGALVLVAVRTTIREKRDDDRTESRS